MFFRLFKFRRNTFFTNVVSIKRRLSINNIYSSADSFTESWSSTQHLKPNDYDYYLPESRIASSPVTPRDASKLLVAERYTGKVIADARFFNLLDYIPPGAVLVSNISKVISARLFMKKSESGGSVEVLCLDPLAKITSDGLDATESCDWMCFVRGKNIKKGTHLAVEKENLKLQAIIMEKRDQETVVRFTWKSLLNDRVLRFRDILQVAGTVPLPPYLKREATKEDRVAYQTVYATQEGSVAAPTAGLHFTSGLITKLQEKNVKFLNVTLHVGAGTFKPVVTDSISDHVMHDERFQVSLDCLRNLLRACQQKQPIVAVGTTSVRTLETCYWIGYKILTCKEFRQSQSPTDDLFLEQWFPYQKDHQRSAQHSVHREQVLKALVMWLEDKSCDIIMGRTKLIIVPSYPFLLTDAIITNFHQPRSTLLMLVAGFLGDKSKLFSLYQHALNNNYRFLSYGDGSLIAPSSFFEKTSTR